MQYGTEKYTLQRTEVKSFVILSENQMLAKKNLYLELLLTRIFATSVDNSSYNGTITKSHFNFKNYNINLICLYRYIVQISPKPLQPILKMIDLFAVTHVSSIKVENIYRKTGIPRELQNTTKRFVRFGPNTSIGIK